MNDIQIQLVKQSWSQVEPIAPVAAGLFYDRLFAVAPDVRDLFEDDLTEQRRKLMKMIGVVVAGLDRLQTILPAVQRLGRRHGGYGASPEHIGHLGRPWFGYGSRRPLGRALAVRRRGIH